ncbi:MAG: DUF3363 domain-containing protein, partial [Sneathiella sp.]
ADILHPQFSNDLISKARLFVESHTPFAELANADGATWLDRKLLATQPETYREKGFGADANRAMKLRQRWLVQEGLMTQQGGQLVAQRRMLEELTKRNVAKMGRDLAKRLDLNHVNPSELGASNAKIARSVKLASGRFAVLQKGKEFALVPWRQAMQLRSRANLDLDTRKGMAR